MSAVYLTAEPSTLAEDELGEGVIWDDRSNCLTWVDISRGLVNRSKLAGGSLSPPESRSVHETVGAVALAQDGGLLVAGARRLHAIDPQGVAHAGPDLIGPNHRWRLNDGAVDPAGRYLVGTLALDDSKSQESLFQVGSDTGIKTVRTGLGVSNGIDWSPSGDRIYHIDTNARTVWSASYEVGSGAIGRWETQFEVRDGWPDGLTVDAVGNLWIAVWGAGQVREYSPEGALGTVVQVEAPNTSCAAFVGPGLDLLAITTAREGLSPVRLEEHPLSGALFLVATNATGLPARRWAESTTAPEWPVQVGNAAGKA